MAQLAIKGHKTRGKKVIQLLEMLGGMNVFKLDGTMDNYYYYIDENSNKIYHCLSINPEYGIVYNLEEFEKLYPYKVGDKVTNEYRLPMIIFDVYWDSDFNAVKYNVRFLDDNKTVRTGLIAEELQPYKEKGVNLQRMERKLDEALAKETPESLNKWLDEENMEKRLEPVYELGTGKILYYVEKVSGEKYCPIGETTLYIQDGYEFRDETNNVINAKRITLVRKQPQYPKNYEECCQHLGCDDKLNVGELIPFQQLVNARNAYWKIAGEEMGLEKPWDPDWNNLSTTRAYIKINKGCFTYASRVLVFPTEEMRDAFLENFEDLIKECKELL